MSIDSTDKLNLGSTKTSTLATSDRKHSLGPTEGTVTLQPKNIKTINNDDFEEKQRQMRIKYGSSRAKAMTNYPPTSISSNLGLQNRQQQIVKGSQPTRNTNPRTSSTSTDAAKRMISS